MKILMLSNGYPDYPGSYRGIFIKKLCQALIRQGTEIVVLCPRVFETSPKFEIDEGIPVHRFWYPSNGKPLGQSGKIPIPEMSAYMISGLISALRLILKEKPDIIHGHWIVPTGLIAAIAGKLTGKRVVNTAHGMDIRLSVKFPVSILFRTAVSLSDRITAVASYMRKYQPMKKSIIIPCGIDDKFFEVTPDKRSKTVISTRSLEPVYNIETLIRAVPLVIEKIPETTFLIIGDGSEKESLHELAESLGVSDKVTFTSRIQNAEIPEYFKKAKAYVSTSLEDGTSVSLLEALASGLIPVVTDIEANREWVKDNSDGFLFKAKNYQEMAKKLINALDSDDINIRDKNISIQEKKITWAAVSSEYMMIYEKLMQHYDITS